MIFIRLQKYQYYTIVHSLRIWRKFRQEQKQIGSVPCNSCIHSPKENRALEDQDYMFLNPQLS